MAIFLTERSLSGHEHGWSLLNWTTVARSVSPSSHHQFVPVSHNCLQLSLLSADIVYTTAKVSYDPDTYDIDIGQLQLGMYIAAVYDGHGMLDAFWRSVMKRNNCSSNHAQKCVIWHPVLAMSWWQVLGAMHTHPLQFICSCLTWQQWDTA